MLTLEEYVALPAVKSDFTYHYGTDEKQFADLYLPTALKRVPVVVLVHGGCWQSKYGMEQLGLMCEALVQEGSAVWNLEYRTNGNGGGWPQTFLDVATGIDFLFQLAEPHQLDLSRVVLVGHSAGGTMVSWAAAREKMAVNSVLYQRHALPVRHVVCLAGIVDLIAAEKAQYCQENLPAMLGGTTSEVLDHYLQVSPMALLPLGVPQTHIIGEHDIQALEHAERYVHTAWTAGETVKMIMVPEAGHYDLVVPTTPAWSAVRMAICLALKT